MTEVTKTPPQTFTLDVIPEHRIVRFTFYTYGRDSIDAWAKYVRAQDGKNKDPLRVLYDFTHAGLPTPYANRVSTQMMHELHIVAGTRTAYLVNNMQFSYYRLLATRMPKKAGEVRAFINYNEAVTWLTRPANPTIG